MAIVFAVVLLFDDNMGTPPRAPVKHVLGAVSVKYKRRNLVRGCNMGQPRIRANKGVGVANDSNGID